MDFHSSILQTDTFVPYNIMTLCLFIRECAPTHTHFYFIFYVITKIRKESRRKFIFTSATRPVIGEFNNVTKSAEFSHKFTPL